MTAGVLKHTLVVRHPDTLAATPLVAGSEVPDWAEDLVHPDDLDSSDTDGSEPKRPRARKATAAPEK